MQREGAAGAWHIEMAMGGGDTFMVAEPRPGRDAVVAGRLVTRPCLLIPQPDQRDARHGYDMIQEIETRTGGTLQAESGVMYPALGKSIQDPWLGRSAHRGRKERRSNITADGKAELGARNGDRGRRSMRASLTCCKAEEMHPTDVRTAMHRLRHCHRKVGA